MNQLQELLQEQENIKSEIHKFTLSVDPVIHSMTGYFSPMDISQESKNIFTSNLIDIFEMEPFCKIENKNVNFKIFMNYSEAHKSVYNSNPLHWMFSFNLGLDAKQEFFSLIKIGISDEMHYLNYDFFKYSFEELQINQLVNPNFTVSDINYDGFDDYQKSFWSKKAYLLSNVYKKLLAKMFSSTLVVSKA